MTGLLFSLLLHLSTPALAAATFPDDCVDELKKFAQEESLKVSCTILDIAAKILEGKDTVPPRIYHFGKPDIIKRNVEARTIPQKDWDDYIMGEKNRRFPLTAIRRGLYGTHHIDTNFFFDNEFSGMMEIEIKEECRKPDKVATMQNLEKDPRFIAWLKKQPEEMPLEKFAGECSYFTFNNGFGYPQCNSLAAKFLQEADIKVIQDSAIQKSFYIRDRNCIATIRGTEEELLESLANNPALIFHSCESKSALNGAGLLQNLLANSISQQKISPQTLAGIQANARLASNEAYIPREPFLKGVDAFVACKKANPKADCREKVKAAAGLNTN